MNEIEIFEKLKAIIVEQLGIEDERVKLDSTLLDDLSADSLDIVELVMNIEEQFGISISDEEAETILTVRDIVKYIEKNIA